MLNLTYFKYKVQKEIKKLKMNHIIIAKIKRRGKEMEWADSVNELYRKIESGYGLFILARDSLSTYISPLTFQHTSLQHA
jgi:glutamine phosphoribosylpyrophosphate amidotransferase